MSHSHDTPFNHHDRTEFQLERITLFTDAVFAIAITLLIIEISVAVFSLGITLALVFPLS